MQQGAKPACGKLVLTISCSVASFCWFAWQDSSSHHANTTQHVQQAGPGRVFVHLFSCILNVQQPHMRGGFCYIHRHMMKAAQLHPCGEALQQAHCSCYLLLLLLLMGMLGQLLLLLLYPGVQEVQRLM